MRVSRFRACPLCEAICGLEFQYEQVAGVGGEAADRRDAAASGERLVAIRGDDADPFSRGHICPKGNAIIDLESDPDRLRRPLRRDGDAWHEIGWDEAFAFAGERLAAIQREHGANAVGAYLGNPTVHHFGHIAYLPALLRAVRSQNVYSASSVDQWPHQLVNWLMYGHQFLLPIPDIDRCDYFLMLGANPVASNGSLMTAPGIAKRLKALTARGRLVVVDPRRTETADIASEHVFIRPGSDVWLLLSLVQELARIGAPRLEAYAGRIAGWDAALAVILAIDTAALTERTGIDRERVRRIAAELHAVPRAAVYGRIGVSTQRHGTLCQWLMQILNLYTGNLDREGGVLPNDPAMPITGPGTSPGHRARWSSRVRGLPEFAGELPVAVLAEEILTGGPGQIRALLTCAGNPVLSTPNGRALEGALSSLGFMLSIDVCINETTRFADLILPPASPLTQHHYDNVFNAFAVRRVARLNMPFMPVPEGERADWQIVDGLGAAYCREAGKPWTALPEPREMIAAGLARGDSGLSIEALAAAPHGLDLGPLRPSLLRRLETASGMIECAPTLMMEALADLAPEGRAATANGACADGFLLLIGRRELRSNNSWMHNAPRLIKGKPRHHLLVHADDLARRGIDDGARVRVRSAAGEIVVEARRSDDMMPGVACLPHGYGHDRGGARQSRAVHVEGASYNDLTDAGALDVPSGNAALSGVPIWIEQIA